MNDLCYNELTSTAVVHLAILHLLPNRCKAGLRVEIPNIRITNILVSTVS